MIMHNEATVNLTNFTRNCFEEIQLCTFTAPAAYVATIFAFLVSFATIFTHRVRSSTTLFGIGNCIGTIQGFLLVRYSQGQNKEREDDNDIAMFFLGLFVIIACCIGMIIDFFQTLTRRKRKGVVLKMISSGIAMTSAILIYTLSFGDEQTTVGTISLGCLCAWILFHIVLLTIAAYKKDKRVIPFIYLLAFGLCFFFWAGSFSDFSDETLSLSITFCSGVVIYICLITIHIMIRPPEKAHMSSGSFGQNIKIIDESRSAEE